MTDRDHIGWFNALERAEAEALLHSCCASRAWVGTVLEGRPYPTATALLKAAATACEKLPAVEVGAALAVHPRIGEAPEDTGRSADWSRQEQAGVRVDEETKCALVRANAAYERKFGRVFLIAASGLSTHQVLAALGRRLRNDPMSEHAEVVAALRDIAGDRLGRALSAGASKETA